MKMNTFNNNHAELKHKIKLGLGGSVMLKPRLIAWLEESEIQYEELYTTGDSFSIYIPDDAHRLMAKLRWTE